jgi:hypothetical protein
VSQTLHSAIVGIVDSQGVSEGMVVVGVVVRDAGNGVFCGVGEGLGVVPSK